MDGEEMKPEEMRLDELADLHSRLAVCETVEVSLSRRITALEEGARGVYNDDPLKSMAPMIWVMVLLTVAPLVIDLVKSWRSSPSS